MTKKRFLAMLLTGAMTLSLAACGGTSTGSDAGTDSGADSGSDYYSVTSVDFIWKPLLIQKTEKIIC